MLSFFDLLIFTTTCHWSRNRCCWLWFAFILWFIDIYHNANGIITIELLLWFAFILWFIDIYHNAWYQNYTLELVVICFHSLIYWYLPQLVASEAHRLPSCDLLSFFDLLIFTTTLVQEVDLVYSCDLLSFFDLLIFTTTLIRFELHLS